MSARTLTALAQPRAALLLALLALAALAAVVLAPPTSAAPPDDLTLSLSLIEDSDDIVPAGGSLQLRATLSSATATPAPALEDITGTLRVSGSQEWEHNGRSSYSVAATYGPGVAGYGPGVAGAATGWDVAVQERTAAQGGDIVAVGAPYDDYAVDADTTHDNAGSVDLVVNGSFVKRLTAPTPAANALFGHSVDVGGGLIVVGAPGANLAYLYDAAGALVATLSPPLPMGMPLANLDKFGYGVAIDDAGETIVVGSTAGRGGSALNGAAYFFLKPATGWANATATAANSVGYGIIHRGQDKNLGGVVDISGNGQVLIIGAGSSDTSNGGDNKNGAVLVYYRHATTAWTGHNTSPNAILLVPTGMQGIAGIRTGDSVAISYDGREVVAGAAGTSDTANWKGAAFLWVTSGSWSGGINNGIALTDADSADGDRFGHSVAISDSGDRVIVSNAWKQANNYQAGDAHIFDKPATGWVVSSAANTVLESPRTVAPAAAANLFFGSAVALDGENSVVIGQTETLNLTAATAADNVAITTGHGLAYAFDLSAADAQASALRLGDPLPCSSKMLDGTTTWTCPVDLDTTPGNVPMITIPAGTPDGAFTISASFTVDDKKLSATLPVTIGTVNEADHAEFDFALNPGNPEISGDPLEMPYPSEIAAGDSTQLQLKILSSVDKPAGADAVSTLLFTTNMGSLNLLKPAGAAMGDCDLTCQVDVTKLKASNSGDIVVELTHPGAGKSGTAMVRAQVLPKTGGALLPIDPVTVILSGPAAKLTVSEPATGVLNINTATGDDDAAETRDRLRLSVSATDASGNKANVPATPRSTLIKGPNGAVIWRSSDANNTNFAVAWPLTTTEPDGDDEGTEDDIVNVLTADGKLQVELDVNAPAATPLKSGAYTLEVTAGSLKAARTFMVSGGPESIVFGEPDGELTVGERFTLPVMLSDAAGAAVPDGTMVTFTLTPNGAMPVLVELRKKTTTTDGQASVTYQVISAGRASVRASAGDAGDVTVISTTDLPTAPAAPANPADSLSPKMPNEYSSWLGEGATTASALLDGLGDGFSTILLWSDGDWLRYGVLDGRRIPGTLDFEVTRGAVLWLGSAN